MALEAVDVVVHDDALMELFNLPKELWPAIKKSWEYSQTDFQGRFDFEWSLKTSGTGNTSVPLTGKLWNPKMLEYNADTPSLQLETSVLSE